MSTKRLLSIPFSHYYKKMPLGVNKAGAKTILKSYTVVNKLSPEFIEYDTAIAAGGDYRLPAKGPYLILFLETIMPVTEYSYRWTTVRLPWRRQAKDCGTCANRGGCPVVPVWCSGGWQPIIPAKYRLARGKEVKIVIEERC